MVLPKICTEGLGSLLLQGSVIYFIFLNEECIFCLCTNIYVTALAFIIFSMLQYIMILWSVLCFAVNYANMQKCRYNWTNCFLIVNSLIVLKRENYCISLQLLSLVVFFLAVLKDFKSGLCVCVLNAELDYQLSKQLCEC